MAVKQITDAFLNRQKRFAEGITVTVPALQVPANKRLGKPDEYIVDGDEYHSYSIPANCIVNHWGLYVREAFTAGTVTVTMNPGPSEIVLFTGTVLTAAAFFALDIPALLFTDVTNVSFVFTGTAGSQVGVVQLSAAYVSIDEKSGKYVDGPPVN